MSNSVQLRRWQPIRLPRLWDSLGKNTGVGCHCLLQCLKVKSESEVAQSCLTLHNPMDCSLPGPSVHGIFQAGVLEWGAMVFSVCIFCMFHSWFSRSPTKGHLDCFQVLTVMNEGVIKYPWAWFLYGQVFSSFS